MRGRFAIGLLAIAAMAMAAPAPSAIGTSGACRVRNVTQATHGTSFRLMVWAAHDGDRLTVRGTCEGGVAVHADITITGVGDPRPVLTGRDRMRVLWIARGARVVLRHLAVAHGRDVALGGVAIRGNLSLIDSIVRDNAAFSASGGGIGNSGRLTLTRSVVRGNHAEDHGGGVWNIGDLILVDTVVRGNSAGQTGGGIANRNGGTIALTRSEVHGNHAEDSGGGIMSETIGGLDSVTIDDASSVTGNTPDDCYGTDAC